MYLKKHDVMFGRDKFYQVKVISENEDRGNVLVEFNEEDGISTMWLIRRGKTCSRFYDYSIVEKLPKGAMARAYDGWVEYHDAAFYFDWSGDLASAPIVEKTYEPDYNVETKVCDFAEPISDTAADRIMSLIA